MRGSKGDVPTTLVADEAEIREIEWGEMHIGFETYHREFDIGPLMKGLPDDRCQCPHWGYVIKGAFRVRYQNREEIVNAGDAYYLPAGHNVVMAAGTEVVEFSPKEPYQRVMEVVTRNFEAQQQG
jgi:hypothetical protein